MDSRRSFHVCYAGDDDGWVRAVDVLEPPYRVSRIDPGETLDSLPASLESDVDCLIVTDEFRGDQRSWADLLEVVRADRPAVSIVPVVSSPSADQFRSLLRADIADIVFRDDGADTADAATAPDTVDAASDPAVRLRNRIDDVYDDSVTDVSTIVLELARSLMGAAPDEVDIEIEWGLGSIGTQLNATQCLVFEYDADADQLEPTHSWTAASTGGSSRTARSDSTSSLHAATPSSSNADGSGPSTDETADTVPSQSHSVGATRPTAALPSDAERAVDIDMPIDTASIPGFEDSLREFDVHAIPSESSDGLEIDVPDDFIGDLAPQDDGDDGDTHPYLERHGLEAFLAIPIVIDWELRGALVVGQDHDRSWPERLRRQLRVLAGLIGHTLERTRRRRELVRKNERLERFASVVSHDLRNPLNVITGSADMAAETGDLSYLEHIVTSAERMDVLIEDLLTLARDGDELGATEPVALESVVRNAWNAVDTTTATLEVVDDLPTVTADPGRLRQALENLVRNAIEHNGGDVTVTVERMDGGFAFEDDGTGIPPAKRDRIFEEGVSGSNGTGLGLSIVETVVSAHEWDVRVTEGKRGGARFEVDTGPQRRPSRSIRQ